MAPDAQRTPARHLRALVDDPPMRLLVVLAPACVAWWLLVLTRPVGPLITGWLAAPVCCVLAALVCIRTGRSTPVPPAARAFWRWVGIGLAAFAPSMISRLFDSLNPDFTMTARMSSVSAIGHGIGLLVVIWPLFKLPLGVHSRPQRIALWLDISTVVLATAVFMWHFSVEPLRADAADGGVTSIAANLALMASGLTGAFVVTKVAITGSATVDRAAMGLLGGALAVGGLGAVLTPLADGRPWVDTSLLEVPVACLLVALGARHQQLSASAPGGGARPRRRRFSVLPYLAVAATDALLLATVVRGDAADRLVVALGAVVLTAVVVVRQIIAFLENDGLTARLDRSLLELRHQEQRFRSLVQNASDIVMITAIDGAVTYVSPAVLRVLGYEPTDVLGRDLRTLAHPHDVPTLVEHSLAVAAVPGSTATCQIRLAHDDGSWRWVEMISANLTTDPSVGGIVSNMRDVTQAREYQDRLSYEATHDALTGLANRALLHQRLGAAAVGHRPGSRFTVVLVDLDEFKMVNDTLGHAAGDALLVHVARGMTDELRPGDTVARLGGDEFAILLLDLTADEVRDVVDRIAGALRAPVDIDGHPLSVKASFGAADGGPGDDPGELMRRADIAMYDAKANGEGGLRWYRSELTAGGSVRGTVRAASAIT